MAKRTIASTNISIGVNLKGLQRGLRTAQTSLKKFGGTAKKVGGTISRNITLPFAAAGTAGVTMAVQLEQSFAKIENLVGITGQKLEEFKNGVKSVSTETAKSQQELSEALFAITSAGIRGSEAIDVLDRAAKASAIGLGDTKVVAHALTGVLQAYSKEGLTAAEATDTLTAIVREGNLEAESLAPTLGRVVGIAAQLGVSFEEVGANIATFTRLGVPAEEAVVGLRGVLNTMLNPSKEAERVLATLGMTATDLADRVGEQGLQNTLQFLLESFEGNDRAVATLFGNVRALSNVLGTAGAQGEVYADVLNNIEHATGIVDEGFDNVSKGSAFQFKKVLNELKNTAIELGATLLPVVTKIANFITKAIQVFQSLSGEIKTALLTITVAVAASGPILSAIGFIATAIGALLSPVGLLVAGIALAAYALVKYWNEAKPIFVKIINAWIDAYNEVFAFRAAVQFLVFIFKSVWDGIKIVFQNITDGFKNIGNLIIGLLSFDKAMIVKALDGLKSGFAEVMGDIADEVDKNWEEALANMRPKNKVEFITEDGLQQGIDSVINPLMDMWEKAKGFFTWKGVGGGSGSSGDGDDPATIVKKTGKEAEKATPLVQRLSNAWASFRGNVDLVNMAINELGGAFQEVFTEVINGTEKSFKELTNIVVSSLQKMIVKLIAAAAAAAVLVALLAAAGIGSFSIKSMKEFSSGFKTIFGQLSGVKLAKGGLAYGETLAVVGDNPNARMDPEVIAPLSKLQNMIGKSGSGGGVVTVVGKLSGQDILLSTEKANRTRTRYRGF